MTTTLLDTLVGLVGNVIALLDGAAAGLLGVQGLGTLSDTLDTLQNTLTLPYNETVPVIVEQGADGSTIIRADFTDGLGQNVRQTYNTLINTLIDNINALEVDGGLLGGLGFLINPILDVIRDLVSPLTELATDILDETSGVLTNVANINVGGNNNLTLNGLNVIDPAVLTATVQGAVVNQTGDAVLTLGVLNDITTEAPSIIYLFDGYVEEVPFMPAAPSVNELTEDSTAVTGSTTDLPADVPAGTTLSVQVTLPDGSILTAPVTADGTFSVPITEGILAEGDNVTTVVLATDETS